MSLISCIILKSRDSPDSDSVKDRYVEYLEEQQNGKVSINKLVHINPIRFEHVNFEQVRAALGRFLLESDYLEMKFKSLILTSRQTVECLEEALFEGNGASEELLLNETVDCELMKSLDDDCRGRMIVYCVGDATLERFVKLVKRIKRVNLNIGEKLIVRVPSEKQNAQCLARLIEKDYLWLSEKPDFRVFTRKYAFYPCSSIRRDEMARHLSDVGKKSNLFYLG